MQGKGKNEKGKEKGNDGNNNAQSRSQLALIMDLIFFSCPLFLLFLGHNDDGVS